MASSKNPFSGGVSGAIEENVREWMKNKNKGSQSTVDPNNPWDMFATGRGRDANMGDMLNAILGQAGLQGVFDPRGNQAIFGALKQDAARQSLGRTRAALNFARNNAVDPSAYGFAGLMAQLGGQSDLADALMNARTQSGLQSQGFYQNLFNMGLRNVWDWAARDQQYKINQGLAEAGKPNMWGQVLGQVAGTVVPGLFGDGTGQNVFGGGAAPGTGGPRMGQPGFTYPYGG